jgi:hypothetical protein
MPKALVPICSEAVDNPDRVRHVPDRGIEGILTVFDAVQLQGHHQVQVDRSRDSMLTDFGRATLDDRYLLPGESYQDLFARVASAYGDDAAHAPAALRLHQQALVHAGHACAVERGYDTRAADQLLPERGQ